MDSIAQIIWSWGSWQCHENMLILTNAWVHVKFWLVIANLGIAYLSSNQRWKGFLVPVPVVKIGNSLTGSPLSPTDTHRSWSSDKASWTTRKLCVKEQLFNCHFAVMRRAMRIKISWRIMYQSYFYKLIRWALIWKSETTTTEFKEMLTLWVNTLTRGSQCTQKKQAKYRWQWKLL